MHRILYRFHKHIILLSIFLTLVSTALAAQLKLDLNLFSLLPSDNSSAQTFFEVAEEIGFQSLLIALVTMPPDYDQEESESLVDLLSKN